MELYAAPAFDINSDLQEKQRIQTIAENSGHAHTGVCQRIPGMIEPCHGLCLYNSETAHHKRCSSLHFTIIRANNSCH